MDDLLGHKPYKNPVTLLGAALVLLHAVLLAWSAHRHSPIVCEVGHLPAGLSHVQLGQFDLYRVNPPLVRTVAATAVTIAGAKTDWTQYDADPLRRAEFEVGQDFLRANGARSCWLFTVGRWACIPFSIVGAYFCFRWARDLFGVAAGMLALGLWCFSPDILGHGALLTPDVPAAALAVVVGYLFWRWLEKPTLSKAFWLGLAWGVAELTKTTLLALYVVLPAVWLVARFNRRARWLCEGSLLVTAMGLSVLVVNLGYEWEGSCRKVDQFRFQSELFAGHSASSGSGTATGNRLADMGWGWLRLPWPANYVQGMDTQRLDFERGLRSYLGGKWQRDGWWYFYAYALGAKMPLGTWALLALAVLAVLSSGSCVRSAADELALAAPCVAVFLLVSSQTGFSLHPRYVLPALPFLFIWISRSAMVVKARSSAGRAIVLASLVFSVASSLWAYPHSLSYFNEAVGGPRGGHAHLADSAIGWGQDLLYLRRWLERHDVAPPIALASFGKVNPALVGIDYRVPPVGPSEPQASTKDAPQLGPHPGWYAVDVNHLIGTREPAMDRSGMFCPLGNSPHDYRYFQRFSPVALAGYSLYIYHITLGEANTVRAQLGLNPLDAATRGNGDPERTLHVAFRDQ